MVRVHGKNKTTVFSTPAMTLVHAHAHTDPNKPHTSHTQNQSHLLLPGVFVNNCRTHRKIAANVTTTTTNITGNRWDSTACNMGSAARVSHLIYMGSVAHKSSTCHLHELCSQPTRVLRLSCTAVHKICEGSAAHISFSFHLHVLCSPY